MSIAHCRVKTAHSNHYTMGIAQFTLRNTHPNHFFRWAQSHCRVNNAHTNKYSMGIAQCTVCNTHPNHCTMGIAHSRVNNAHSNHYTMDIGHKAVNTTCSIYHSTIVYSVFIRNRAVIRAGIFSDCKNRLSSDKELLDQFKHCNIEILYCCDTSIGTDVCRQPGWYPRYYSNITTHLLSPLSTSFHFCRGVGTLLLSLLRMFRFGKRERLQI